MDQRVCNSVKNGNIRTNVDGMSEQSARKRAAKGETQMRQPNGMNAYGRAVHSRMVFKLSEVPLGPTFIVIK